MPRISAVCALLLAGTAVVFAGPKLIVDEQAYVDCLKLYLDQGTGEGANCPSQLDFAGSNLVSSIPTELGAFAGLTSLSLGTNALTGSIPWSLEG